MALVKTNAFFMPTITFLIGISTILTIYYGGILSFETQNELSSRNIVEFIFYVNMLTWPFASVGWVTSMIQRAAASQERINEFLSQEPEVKNTEEAPRSEEHTSELQSRPHLVCRLLLEKKK